jgi:D-alanyl-D-alanine carboxypeptidase
MGVLAYMASRIRHIVRAALPRIRTRQGLGVCTGASEVGTGETMQKEAGKACYRLRWGIFTLITAVAVVSATTDPADARAKRKRGAKAAAVLSYSPPYADIVVDANTGAVLHSNNPDAPRHPASLAKIMTLYMLFERLEAGKITFKTQLPVSAHAASQAPSKLGLKPGQSITVEEAINATVTKSANDVAAVIAEALGGDEDTFSKLMTAKARSLGMQNTVYKNASGLPNDAQITTARDQAVLGRAIQDHFPQYYRFFSTTRFSFRGKSISGHNRLLGRVEGVDGIKTGYTNASGFNLVTSMKRSGRHVVAVVLGGRSASSRDAKMRALITDYVRVASAPRTATSVLAEATPAAPKRNVVQRIAAAVITPARAEAAPEAALPQPRHTPAAGPPIQVAAASLETLPAASSPAAGLPGSSQPLEPIAVKTLSVKPGVAVLLAAPMATTNVTPATVNGPVLAFADPDRDRHLSVLGTIPATTASAMPMQAAPQEPAVNLQRPAQRPGWVIQVGAFDKEDEAKLRLNAAQARAKSLLGEVDGFTERVVKGDKTLYRARFAGLGKEQAEAACQHLKKNEIACMALKN